MRASFSVTAVALGVLAMGVAHAAPPAATSPNDPEVQSFVQALAHDPCPDGAARPASGVCAAPPAPASVTVADVGTSGCVGGLPRSSEGVCLDPPDSTQNFSLLKTPQQSPVSTRPAAPRVRRPRPVESQALDNIRVEFRAGSADLTPEGQARALKFAAALNAPQYASRRFEIAGHTDKSGPADTNEKLSQARAEAVRQFLVANGVDGARLEAKGYGFSHPAYPDAPFDPRNRRVEAVSLN